MRPLVCYLLLVATLLPTVSPWGTIAAYRLNKEYIARVLCENRDRPQRHCDGKCYLAKRLKAQQDRQDKEITERLQQAPVMQLFCEAGVRFQFIPVAVRGQRPVFVYLSSTYPAPPASLLKPPCSAWRA